MGRARKNRTIELEITGLNHKGNGTGSFYFEGTGEAAAEVPFAIPGDRVRACTRRKRSGRYLSFMEELLAPSEFRVAPRCRHFGRCGGCRWQQMDYERQLAEKEAAVRSAFSPLLSAESRFYPIIPCSKQWHYRNKMEFSFSQDAQGERYLGLVMDSSKGKVLDLEECHLVSPWFVKALETARGWWKGAGAAAYNIHRNEGALRTLMLREGMSTGDRMVMLTVSGNPDYALNKEQLDAFVSAMREAVSPEKGLFSIVLRIQQVAKGMATNFYEMILYGSDHIREELNVQIDPEGTFEKLLFHISPTAFFQPNTAQAERLYSSALQLAGVPEEGVVYDLYCGTGTLGICAARKAKEVLGIEISLESALDARANAARNGADNVTVLSGAVRHVLGQTEEDSRYLKPDLLLVDPPRPGLDPEAMRNILELKAPKILYVSCNPRTQAENIAEMIDSGYEVTAVQPLDQFAHTPHVENTAILERKR